MADDWAIFGVPSNVPAKDVVSYRVMKDLALMLNHGVLNDWKDLAGELGYDLDQICGRFDNLQFPSFSLLKDWTLCRKGMIGDLCRALAEVKRFDCLDVIRPLVDDYQDGLSSKKPTESCIDEPPCEDKHPPDDEGRLVGSIGMPPSLGQSSMPSIPSESFDDSLSEHTGDYHINEDDIDHPDDGNFFDDSEDQNNGTAEKFPQDQTDCNPKQHSVSDGELNGHRESETENCESSLSCLDGPPDSQRTSLPPKRSRWALRLIKRKFKKSVSVDDGSQVKGRKSKKHSKKLKKKDKTKQGFTEGAAVESERESHVQVTVHHHEEVEKEPQNFSPVIQESSGNNRLVHLEAKTGRCSRTKKGQQSSTCKLKTKTPKELLILYHKDTTEQAKTVYNFFFERNYSCIFHHMDVQKGPYAGTVQQMQHADFVLICISPMLKEAFDSLPENHASDEERALKSAANMMVSDMGFHCQNRGGKYMPVLFSGEANAHVPYSLLPLLKYNWPTDQDTLLSVMNDQPQVPLSEVKKEKYVPKSKQIPAFSEK